ncbi:MAG TPA: hypothetical protein PJ996_11025 [Nitrosomonas sp.]|nr:hypothetical protein [Nitrosomonas sp.]
MIEELNQKQHNARFGVLHDRSTWRGLSEISRTCLLEAMWQRYNFSLTIQCNKNARRNGTMMNFPPLELALLRSEQPLSLAPSVTVNLWQHYQIVKRIMSGNPEIQSVTSVAIAKQRLNALVTSKGKPIYQGHKQQLTVQSENSSAFALSAHGALRTGVLPVHYPRHSNKQLAMSMARQAPLKHNQHDTVLSGPAAELQQNPLNRFEKLPALALSTHRTPRSELSPAQYFKRSGKLPSPTNQQAHQQHSQHIAVRRELAEGKEHSSPNSLADILFDRAMQSQPRLPSDFSLRMLPPESAEVAVQANAPDTKSMQLGTKSAVNSKDPIQLNGSDITRVADQVAQVLNRRKKFERERRGEFC